MEKIVQDEVQKQQGHQQGFKPISPPQIQRSSPRLLLKPKAKKVTEDTKKKAKDGDKLKTEPKTEPKKKPRKQAEPKRKPRKEGNKDLEQAAAATPKAQGTPKVERSSISGKIIVGKTVIKDKKDDA